MGIFQLRILPLVLPVLRNFGLRTLCKKFYSNFFSILFCFRMEVLREKSQIDDGIGYPEWRLTICLFVAWVITCAVSLRGVKSSGKASYFLALFPYVIMITLLIRAVTLEGAGQGMLFFIKPKWEKLLSADVSTSSPIFSTYYFSNNSSGLVCRSNSMLLFAQCWFRFHYNVLFLQRIRSQHKQVKNIFGNIAQV